MFKLSRRKGSSLWQVRKRWPADVAAILKGEFVRSTGEADRKRAELRLPIIAGEYVSMVEEARRRLADNRYRDLSEAEIRRLASKFYAEALPAYRIKGPLAPDKKQELVKQTLETIHTLTDDLSRQDPVPVAALTRRLVEREGLPIPEGSPSLHALQLAVHRALLELHKGVLGQLEGHQERAITDPELATLIGSDGKPLRTVSDLIDAYDKAESGRWSQSTIAAKQPVYRLLRDAIGDRPVEQITREDARAIVRLVEGLPAGLGKVKALAGMKVPEAVEAAKRLGLRTLAPGTVNRGYLVHISSIFTWARKEQWIAANPFEGLSVHDPVPEEDKRDPFTPDQLQALFGSAPWQPRDETKPARFWVPLLCAFHGLRLGEAAGLLVAHVEEREGVAVLLLRAYEERRLKTASSRGVLPVHPELIRIGFLEYVGKRRSIGEAPLFPDAKVNVNGKGGAKVGEWFVGHVKKLGLKGRKLGMHSFRHAFEDRIREAELAERTALALARRSERGSSGRYGDGLPIRTLAAAMEKIAYPGLDLSHLYIEARQEAA